MPKIIHVIIDTSWIFSSWTWSGVQSNYSYMTRLRVVPHFSSGIVEQAKRERAWKSPHARKGDTRRGERIMLPAACRFFSRGMIFKRARVSHALLSPRKNGGLLVVYYMTDVFELYYLLHSFSQCCKKSRWYETWNKCKRKAISINTDQNHFISFSGVIVDGS